MEMAALMTASPAPLFASKNTSSVDVGTEALLAPPEVALQFVFTVAFQFVDDPPATQYRLAISIPSFQ